MVVTPATATVDTGASRQFTATYYDTLGFVAVPQPTTTWTASAGSVTAGLYTAGSDTASGILVIATYTTIADTAIVRVVYPSGSVIRRGLWKAFRGMWKVF